MDASSILAASTNYISQSEKDSSFHHPTYMPSNKELYFKSLLRAFIIELIVMAVWIFPLMNAGMNHSAAAVAQTPWIMQVIGFLGFIFHFPSIVLAFLVSTFSANSSNVHIKWINLLQI